MTAVPPARGARDRPAGLAPAGTTTTFTLGLLYPFFTLAFTLAALLPWLTDGTEASFFAWIDRICYATLAGAVLTVIVAVPYVLAYKARRYAAVWLFFLLGLISAVAVPAAVLLVAGLLIASWRHPPDLVVFAWLFGGFLLAMLATWPWLVRGLRLRYWQPWTTPDQWEVGNERVAGWAQTMAGIEDRRPATDGTRPPIRRRRR